MNEIKLVLEEDKGEQLTSLRHVERKKLRKAAQESNEILAHIRTADITGTNRLVRAAAIVVTRRLGIKKISTEPRKEPFWIRRIQKKIDLLIKGKYK